MVETKQSILVIEDDLDVARLLQAFFRAHGYEVFCAFIGLNGVNQCRNMLPNIVILDIGLPDIDGYEVARRLRSSHRTSEIPIVFLTEKGARSDRLYGLELGADDYIPKPFDIQELRLRIRNGLHRSNQASLINLVTGLPDGKLVNEHLSEFLEKRQGSLVTISMENMDIFRESYGFLASDDVLRVVGVIVQNIMKELGCQDDFLGHLGPTVFFVITGQDKASNLEGMIIRRLGKNLDYFYPIKDRGKPENQKQKIFGRIQILREEDKHFSSQEELRASLLREKT